MQRKQVESEQKQTKSQNQSDINRISTSFDFSQTCSSHTSSSSSEEEAKNIPYSLLSSSSYSFFNTDQEMAALSTEKTQNQGWSPVPQHEVLNNSAKLMSSFDWSKANFATQATEKEKPASPKNDKTLNKGQQ